MVDVKKIALFVGGVVFGSAGFKLLSSSLSHIPGFHKNTMP